MIKKINCSILEKTLSICINFKFLRGVNQMNLAHHFKQLFVFFSVSAILITALPATAGVKGSMSIDIFDGCLSISGGCGNPDPLLNTTYATGGFVFSDTRPADFATNPLYSFFAETHVEANNSNGMIDDDRSKSFDSFGDLMDDPQWLAALGVFQAVTNGDDILGPGIIPPGVDAGTFTIEFEVFPDVGSTPNNITGSFIALSTSPVDELNKFSNLLFGEDLPDETVAFSASAKLSVIPEPISLALLGLGMVAMASTRRKHA